MTAITGLATALPAHRISQDEVATRFIALQGKDSRRARAMRTIFDRAGVHFRHSVIAPDEGYYEVERTTQARNDRYMQEALPLGAQAIEAALASAALSAHDIDEFVVVSCTGFNIPGLDLHLAGRLGMRPDLQRTHVFGMGCYGSFPGLRRARDAAAAGRRALMLSVELCSLHLQMDDTAENVVSTALFSDGAAAALVDGTADTSALPRIMASMTHCDYQTLDHMAFNVTDHGFRMYLSSYVPDLLAAHIETFVDRLLSAHGLTRSDVRHWGIHPGSTKIVDYVQERLGLRDEQVEHSHAILHDYGNMSSATILFVLERIQRCDHPAPGEYGVLMAFGPGLTMEAMLVQW